MCVCPRPDRRWGPRSLLLNGYWGKAVQTWGWPLTYT